MEPGAGVVHLGCLNQVSKNEVGSKIYISKVN